MFRSFRFAVFALGALALWAAFSVGPALAEPLGVDQVPAAPTAAPTPQATNADVEAAAQAFSQRRFDDCLRLLKKAADKDANMPPPQVTLADWFRRESTVGNAASFGAGREQLPRRPAGLHRLGRSGIAGRPGLRRLLGVCQGPRTAEDVHRERGAEEGACTGHDHRTGGDRQSAAKMAGSPKAIRGVPPFESERHRRVAGIGRRVVPAGRGRAGPENAPQGLRTRREDRAHAGSAWLCSTSGIPTTRTRSLG